MDLPPRPNAADVKDALDYVSTPPNGSPVARTLAAEVLHLRAENERLRAVTESPGCEPACAERDHETGAPMPCAAEVENEHLRARVAALEAERSGMRATEWGVRWDAGWTIDPIYSTPTTEGRARQLQAERGGALVQRDVPAPGPWRAAQ